MTSLDLLPRLILLPEILRRQNKITSITSVSFCMGLFLKQTQKTTQEWPLASLENSSKYNWHEYFVLGEGYKWHNTSKSTQGSKLFTWISSHPFLGIFHFNPLPNSHSSILLKLKFLPVMMCIKSFLNFQTRLFQENLREILQSSQRNGSKSIHLHNYHRY